MKEYEVIFANTRTIYLSTSRNSKRHLRKYGGDWCQVYYKNVLVSWASRDAQGKIYNCRITE